MILLLFVMVAGSVSLVSGAFLLWVLGMRRIARQGFQKHQRPREVASHPECTCYYDSDGGPYGLPHVVNGHSCEQYYRENGSWPDWCRYVP